MDKEINEDVLIVLKKNNETGLIIATRESIINPLKDELDGLKTLCELDSSDLDNIASFINATPSLLQLDGNYRYSQDLTGRDQFFTFSNAKELEKIRVHQDIQKLNEKLDEKYIAEKSNELKKEIKEDYVLCSKAYAINFTYRKCYDDKDILTFSHRITGWSNPTNQLNENFSLEFITNFGYGTASYFYTLLKYKNIELSAFSEWIKYYIANASEIIRFTKSHSTREINKFGNRIRVIQNDYWIGAMLFARDACNLSLKSEKEFVDKYILQECERMVTGLENFLKGSSFSFEDVGAENYERNNIGHVLIQFKGEKISGALEFINKIMEFKDILAIDDFINRIKECNKSIQPILINELQLIEAKLKKFNSDLIIMKPIYDQVVEESHSYSSIRNEIINQIVISEKTKRSLVDMARVESLFLDRVPNYQIFVERFKIVTQDYADLTQKITIHSEIHENIKRYEKNISEYFK